MAEKIPFWRNSKVLQIVGQIVVLLIVLGAIAYLGNNLVNNFRRLNLTFGFDFLSRPASFDIGNPLIEFRATDSNTRAILVGLLNSLRVMFFGIILAAFLGITVGIGRLSDNWLVRKVSAFYVELLRNTPLLLQLLFWYFAVFLKLPKIEDPLEIANSVFLTNRGLDIPWFVWSGQTWLAFGLIFLSAVLCLLGWRKYIAEIEAGRNGNKWLRSILLIAIAMLAVFFFGINWEIPQLQAASIVGGLNLSPEYATILIGLSVYTAAFIAEVVRAGIQSVAKGQWEAAKALGLKPGIIMQEIVFPQALRVMIPPLTSEFLNLAKNSSLAIAIGYSDVYAISSTISTKTGKSVEMLLVIMVTYLTINLIISAIMNRFNNAVQLKER